MFLTKTTDKRERNKEGVRAGRGQDQGGGENGGMKAISCLRLEVSDSVKMSEKAFKTHLHFTLALLQYAIISSESPFCHVIRSERDRNV
jgi:hypothetical protein